MQIHNLSVDFSRFNRDDILAVRKVKLSPAGCPVDLGDGSERGEYVDQDYILQKLGRPMRRIALMYTYYPRDPEWPSRSSEAYPEMEVHGQWDYPYDDYFPYHGGLNGMTNAKVFREIRDIRRHGEDVLLTLTCDCRITDEEIIAIAKDLRPFGRLALRVNHECAGTWFTHNRRYSYEEIGQFFVKFCRIVKEYAPNVSMIFCSGFIGPDGKMEREEAFVDAFRAADIWSGDKYYALHFGWPFDVCDAGDPTYAVGGVNEYIDSMNKTVARLTEICEGVQKPFSASEFNIDGDVTGPVMQGESLLRFVDHLEKEQPDWKYSMSMYQFRDRGRLGLEIEDPNNPEVGIPQPLMEDFKSFIHRPYFLPGVEDGAETLSADAADVPLRWGGAEDAEGIAMKIRLKDTPVFFDIHLPQEANVILQVNGRWFYKKPGVRMIDAMPAFFSADAKPVTPGEEIEVLLFAPPADGENPETDAEDWATNYRTTLSELPKFRIRYAPCAKVR